jgi:hypothetical protein
MMAARVFVKLSSRRRGVRIHDAASNVVGLFCGMDLFICSKDCQSGLNWEFADRLLDQV